VLPSTQVRIPAELAEPVPHHRQGAASVHGRLGEVAIPSTPIKGLTPVTLKQDIDAFVAEIAGRLPPALLIDLQKSIDDVRASNIADRALAEGDIAPDFTLPNAFGQPIALADLLRRGPLIVSFYRGIWCPYCNLELRAYQAILAEIRAAGGDFIAISPQTPDHSRSTRQKNALEFEVLSDHGNQVAAKLGIAYATPEAVKQITSMFGADIAAINGADDDRLPISATYLIGSDHIIVLASADPDFRVRLEPADALAALRRLTRKGLVQVE
jgi:peroxiredoxin